LSHARFSSLDFRPRYFDIHEVEQYVLPGLPINGESHQGHNVSPGAVLRSLAPIIFGFGIC